LFLRMAWWCLFEATVPTFSNQKKWKKTGRTVVQIQVLLFFHGKGLAVFHDPKRYGETTTSSDPKKAVSQASRNKRNLFLSTSFPKVSHRVLMLCTPRRPSVLL